MKWLSFFPPENVMSIPTDVLVKLCPAFNRQWDIHFFTIRLCAQIDEMTPKRTVAMLGALTYTRVFISNGDSKEPMPLFERVQKQFSSACRTRGQEYFSAGRVRVLSQNSFLAQFFVRGSEDYTVNFDFKYGIGKLDVHCSCAYFAQGFFCKHVWACLLKMDEENIFAKGQDLKKVALTRSEQVFSDKPISNKTPMTLSWQNVLSKAKERESRNRESSDLTELEFVVDVDATLKNGLISIRTFGSPRLRSGSLGPSRPFLLRRSSVSQIRSENQRDAFKSLIANSVTDPQDFIYRPNSNLAKIDPDEASTVLSKLNLAGNFLIRADRGGPLSAYRFVPTPWTLELDMQEVEGSYFLRAQLTDGSVSRPLKDALASINGLILFREFSAPSRVQEYPEWLETFSRRKDLEIAADELDAFLDGFYRSHQPPSLRLPKSIEFMEQAGVRPLVRLKLWTQRASALLLYEIEFVYHDKQIRAADPSPEIIDVKNRTKIRRDFDFESQAIKALNAASDGVITAAQFLPLVEKAMALGWEVVAHQKRVQAASDVEIKVVSGIDWFDLSAEFRFDQMRIALPQLLANLKTGERIITLTDGTLGLLPEKWFEKFGPLAGLAKETQSGLRFSRVQALFLNSALAENEKIVGDRKFNTLRGVLEDLKKSRPMEPSESFQGTLRDYQKTGLAWLRTLMKNEIGGILADDMGLGKTIQVLALLTLKKASAPALIVAPKSLIFNWIKEAEKFAPHLKVLNLTGPKRLDSLNRMRGFDIVLTTYQSLRMDIDLLKDHEFEYFIMDEAQNIKNPKSQVAMACRLIGARKKVALTGTPIENSLLDLFSILSVVLPGLITDQQAGRWVKENNPATLKTLSQALAPFILRRTKEQVLKDLPEKTEQILYCELTPSEMKKYNDLKLYYWGRLNETLDDKGLSRSKIEILEALLRLRQAACHQGLLDKKSSTQSSAKFEMLLEQMDSIIKDGHKALVFSQFTSLLALLEKRLKKQNIAYEYLDGKTKDREERVHNFQTNPEVKIFLLSLKVGGVGLNLTAADYVFILDPWWNPAAEAQAIDRTHRIGQSKKVMAYRLIAKNTVEEKILELQERKRGLASAIISDETSILKSLKLEDLQALFS
jgi:superfamily II DNA or RNA helicase